MTTDQPCLYALYRPGPGSVVHRLSSNGGQALCGYRPWVERSWYAIAPAPRELPGVHRLCRVCSRRAQKATQ